MNGRASIAGLVTLFATASLTAQDRVVDREVDREAERTAARLQLEQYLERALDGELTAAGWAEFWGVERDLVGERGVRLALATVEPFPFEALDRMNARARRRLLIGLSERSRPSLDAWLLAQSSRDGLEDPVERGLLVAARDPSSWKVADLRALLDLVDLTEGEGAPGLSRDRATRIQQREWRLAVQAALRRVPPQLADRVVGEVHRRLLRDPLAFARYRTVLREISGAGLRVIAAAARTLEAETAGEILQFLSAREPESAGQLALDRYRDGDLSEAVLRLLPVDRLDEDERRVLRLRIDGEGDQKLTFGQSRAVLASLVRGGFVDSTLLRLVTGSAFGSRSLLRRAIRSPRLSVDDLARLHDAVASSERGEIVRELAVRKGGIPVLSDRARAGGAAAISWGLEFGPDDVVGQVWGGFDRTTRERWITTLAKRRDAVAKRLVAAEDGDATNHRVARLRIGDRSEWKRLLDDPNGLPSRWLNRLRDDLVGLIESADAKALVRIVQDESLDAERRAFFCELIERKPALPVGPAMLELAERANHDLVRDAARSAAVARQSERSELIEQLRASLGGAMDVDAWGYAVRLIDACPRPLSATDARFAAELLLRSSPKDTVEGGSDAPVVAVFRLLLGNAAGERADLEFLRAGREVFIDVLGDGGVPESLRGGLENSFGGLFLLSCRDPDARVVLAPSLAELLGDHADLAGALGASVDFLQAERLEDSGRFDEAIQVYDRGWTRLHRIGRWGDLVLRASLPPERAGDVDTRPFSNTAYRAARPWICRARAALERGESELARALLRSAAELAAGDRLTLNEVRDLRQTLR